MESFEVKGPFGPVHAKYWYDLLNDSGDVIANVFGPTQQEALELALVMAGAPVMADTLEDVHKREDLRPPVISGILGAALVESIGINCEVCETLGQPSRMVYSPTNRAYHPTCVPEDVKKEIAAMDAAAAQDDIPY